MSKTETQSEALTAERRLFITAVANLELRKKFGDEGFRLDLERDELEALIEMAERASRLDAENKQLNVALDEWMEKTHWVQDTAQVLELGMHRADVLRARIEALAAENKALRADAERYHHLRDCNSGSIVVMQITGTGEDDWHVLTEGDADEAIDAAMAAAKTGDAAPEIGCKRTGSDGNGGAA